MKPALVIISHYNAWPTDQLVALLDQIHDIPSGHPFQCLVVVNQAIDRPLELPERHSEHRILYRENTGYNIGAWEYGWRNGPPAEYYLFLQEECQIASPNWLGSFVRLLSRPEVGVVGERLTFRGLTWKRIEFFQNGYPFQGLPGDEPIGHVDGLKRSLKARGVPLGRRGDHLQSFILASRRNVLEAIDGFMIGHSKGDAIACELAISLMTVARGMKLKQVGTLPFRYIHHPQWMFLENGWFTLVIESIDRFLPLALTASAKRTVYKVKKMVTGKPHYWEIP